MNDKAILFDLPHIPKDAGEVTLANAADGIEALFAARYAQTLKAPVYYVARDGAHMAELAQIIAFEAPDLKVINFPAWDCLPYDRVSPSAEVSAQRMMALAAIGALKETPKAAIIITSANAVLQRVPKIESVAQQMFSAKPGSVIAMDEITRKLSSNGFERVSTVREIGEFAVRGGILDLFAPGSDAPVRLDFFWRYAGNNSLI
eukprot:GHVR01057484.1.p1 GENE.GHVR01057484.1~~GHVR01057484.1.p1  ORF type:complete len:204 (-),score=20.69 GHVR01057484.1:20-631(-)